MKEKIDIILFCKKKIKKNTGHTQRYLEKKTI